MTVKIRRWGMVTASFLEEVGRWYEWEEDTGLPLGEWLRLTGFTSIEEANETWAKAGARQRARLE